MAGRARARRQPPPPSKRLRRCIPCVSSRCGRSLAQRRSLLHLLAHLALDRVEQTHREVARHALGDEHDARGVVGRRPAIEELRRRERRAARRGSPRAVPASPRCSPAPSAAAGVRRNARPVPPAAGSAPAPAWDDRAAARRFRCRRCAVRARTDCAPADRAALAKRVATLGAGEQRGRRDVAGRCRPAPGLSVASRARRASVGSATIGLAQQQRVGQRHLTAGFRMAIERRLAVQRIDHA